MADAALPDFVIAGNVARDIVPQPPGWRAGGAAVYAAAMARGLGRRVGVVTAATAAAARAGLPAPILVARHPAAADVSFENHYDADGHRTQILRATGEPVPPETVPDAWRDVPVVLLGAVYHEITPVLATRFSGRIGLCAQGFLRRADATGRVWPLVPQQWDAAPLLARVQVMFCSEEDLGGAAPPAAWVARVPVLAVTRGRAGVWIYAGGERRLIPAYPAREVDPTGAGDAFAAAFLIAQDEGHDPWQAARFAAAAAALTVEHPGPYTPTRAGITAQTQQ